MFRRSLAAVVVLFVVASLVVAGSYTGVITKIDKDEITVKVRKDKKDKEGEEKKFKIGKDIKIVRKAKDKDDEKVSMDDLKSAVEKAAKAEKGPKGVVAKITTEGEGDKEAVTEINTFGRKGGK
jgi:hypothetical protein